jgi:hypothetical protein
MVTPGLDQEYIYYCNQKFRNTHPIMQSDKWLKLWDLSLPGIVQHFIVRNKCKKRKWVKILT